jgi:inorganic pyrophosphatase
MAFSRWRPHPWHGLEVGENPPSVVNAFVEMTPHDSMKYEIDKATGYLRIDRPQGGASLPPCCYGFIPRTFCGPRVAEFCPGARRGDGDPLDICIVSEQLIARAEIVLSARVVGGFQILDGDEADDKIVAILAKDAIWNEARDIGDLPEAMVTRIEHYLRTYKLLPGRAVPRIRMRATYGAADALRVVTAAIEDYKEYLDQLGS